MNISPELIGSLFESLLRASWQATLLAGVVLLLQRLLRRWLTPAWRHALWLIVVARLLLPLAPASAWSLFNLTPALPGFQGGNAAKPASAFMPASPGAASDAANVSASPVLLAAETSPTSAALGHSLPATSSAIGLLAIGSLAIGDSAQTPKTEPTGPLSSGSIPRTIRPGENPDNPVWTLLALAIWALGALLLSARLLRSWLRSRRQLRSARPLDETKSSHLLVECRERLRVRRSLRVFDVAWVHSPALCGWWRPRLLLPAGLAERLSPDELRHVLLHELAHLKRHDILVNWIASAAQVLHWFNPVVWLVMRRLRAERELAADRLALVALGEDGAQPYGETILRLMDGLARPAAVPAIVGILEDRRALRERIQAIASFRRPGRWSWLAAWLVGGLAMAGLTDPTGGKGAIPPASPEEPTPAQRTNSTAVELQTVATVGGVVKVPPPDVNAPAQPFELGAFQLRSVRPLRIGDSATPFGGLTTTGESIQLSPGGGTPALLCFWEGGNQYELLALKRVIEAAGAGGSLRVLVLVSERNVAEAKRHWSYANTGWPLVQLADELAVREAYEVEAAPAMILLDANGKVVTRHWEVEALEPFIATIAGENANQRTSPPEGQPLWGTVFLDGRPLEGAYVSYYDPIRRLGGAGRTDAQGRIFVYRNPKATRLVVWHDPFQAVLDAARLTNEFRVELGTSRASIRGTLWRGDQPWPSKELALQRRWPGLIEPSSHPANRTNQAFRIAATTDAQGRFEFRAVPCGVWVARSRHVEWGEFEVRPGAVLVTELGRGGPAIVGQVVSEDASLKPDWRNARVNLITKDRGPQPWPPGEVESDDWWYVVEQVLPPERVPGLWRWLPGEVEADGWFVVPEVPPGDHVLAAVLYSERANGAARFPLELGASARIPVSVPAETNSGAKVLRVGTIPVRMRQPVESAPRDETTAGLKRDDPVVVITVAGRPPHLYLGSQPVTLEQLQAELGALASKNLDLPVAVRVQTNSPVGVLVKVMDAVKAAGLGNASIFTQPGEIGAHQRKPTGLGAVAYAPDGRTIATIPGSSEGTDPGELILWDVAARKARLEVVRGSLARSVAFSPDGQRLALADDAGQITTLDASDGAVIGVLPRQAKPVLAVAYSPDGQTLVSGGLDGAVRLWDVGNSELRRTFALRNPQGVVALAISPDGHWLAASAWMGGVFLWRLDTGETVHEFDPAPPRAGGPYSAVALVFSPDSQQLVTGSWVGTLRSWSVETGELVREFDRGHVLLKRIAFSPDGRRLVCSDDQGVVEIWWVERGERIGQMAAHTAPGCGLAFSPDGRYLATVGGDGLPKLWEVKTHQPVAAFSR